MESKNTTPLTIQDLEEAEKRLRKNERENAALGRVALKERGEYREEDEGSAEERRKLVEKLAEKKAKGEPIKLTAEERKMLFGGAANSSGRAAINRKEAERELAHTDTYEKELDKREKNASEIMRKFLLEGFYNGLKEYRSLKELRDIREVSLMCCEKNIKLKHPRDPSQSRDVARDMLTREVKQVDEDIEKLTFSSPENFAVVKGLEFKDLCKQVKTGRMAVTPYVKDHLERVKRDIHEGKGVFVHGHLGSGKTELAIMAAREAAMENIALEEALVETEIECLSSPMSDDEKDAFRARVYRKKIESFRRALDGKGESHSSGEEEMGESIHDRCQPIIVSGSRDLTTKDLFMSKELEIVRIDDKNIGESLEEIDREYADWARRNPEDAKDPEKCRAESERIVNLYISKNAGFGTKVKNIKEAIYKGIEEGRPVILDEVNAIPAAVLISLNDILQRRPGEYCSILGRRVEIQSGFAIIMTGNLDSSNAVYHGTDELNPAFLSRLDRLEHSYLPMSTVGELDDQANPEDNELFHVILAYLADKNGDLSLPDIEESLRKLFNLAKLARLSCLVFEGKWKQSEALKSSSGDQMDEPRLEKDVLSMRALLDILMGWGKGKQASLDEALWDHFISTMTDPDDQQLTIMLAKECGFFSKIDGWEIPEEFGGGRLVDKREVLPNGSDYTPEKLETYSIYKVLEVMYGDEVPVRDVYPDLEDIESEVGNEADDVFGFEDKAEFREKLKEIEDSIEALKILGEQCGCDIEGEQS